MMMRILLVTDPSVPSGVLQALSQDHDLVTVESIQEALVALAAPEAFFDCVLSGGVVGFELLRRMQAEPWFAGMATFLLSLRGNDVEFCRPSEAAWLGAEVLYPPFLPASVERRVGMKH